MSSVFYEVARIDELPSFPYPEVGVDDDGVLVSRSLRKDWFVSEAGL